MKRNGFTNSLHCLQIVSYVAILLIALGFYSFIMPAFEVKAEVPIVIFYSFALLSTLYHGYKCTACDPTDPSIHQDQPEPKLTPEYTKICKICRSYVHNTSKHCRECDRCVNGFDHHCLWMNNCVGQANYRLFFRMIVSLEITVGIELCLCLFIIDSMFEKNATYERIMKIFHFEPPEESSYIAALILLSILCCILFCLIGHLIGFHIYLCYKGITTYQFIIDRQMSGQNIVPKEPNDSIEELYEPYIIRGDETTYRIEEIRPRYPNLIKKSINVQSEPTKPTNSQNLSNENLQNRYDGRYIYSAVDEQEAESERIEEERKLRLSV